MQIEYLPRASRVMPTSQTVSETVGGTVGGAVSRWETGPALRLGPAVEQKKLITHINVC